MSQDEAFKLALSTHSTLWRWRLRRNIENGVGHSMLRQLSDEAQIIWRWTNYNANRWTE